MIDFLTEDKYFVIIKKCDFNIKSYERKHHVNHFEFNCPSPHIVDRMIEDAISSHTAFVSLTFCYIFAFDAPTKTFNKKFLSGNFQNKLITSETGRQHEPTSGIGKMFFTIFTSNHHKYFISP